MPHSLTTWIDDYITELASLRRSERTRAAYRWHLQQLAHWLIEEHIETPAALSRRTLRRYSAAAAERWSPATHRQAIAAIKGFCTFLHAEEATAKNYADALTLPAVPTRQQRTLTAAEIRALLTAAETLDPPRAMRDTAIIALLTDSGLRAAELCKLQLDTLDLAAGRLVTIGKGDKEAPAYFGDKTRDYLKSWLVARLDWFRSHPDAEDSGALFVSLGGATPSAPLTPAGLRRILADLGQRAGISSVSPHAFRRAFATLLSQAGAPSRLTQILGRWSNLNMVERYTRALETEHQAHAAHQRYSPIDRL